MKSKTNLTQLREAVRGCIDDRLADGPATTAEIAECVLVRHGELVKQTGLSLARTAIVGLVRSELRKIEARTSAAAEQFELPMEIKHLRLSAVISIPSNGEDDDEEGVLWLPWRRATLAQGLRHLELLNEQIARDEARRNAWREVCDFVAAKTGGDLDAVIGAVLTEHTVAPA